MINKIGVHSLVFAPDWTRESAELAINSAAEIGFDHIEVVIFDPSTTDARMTVSLAKKAGIEITAGMALNPAADLSSENPEIAKKGEAVVADCISVTRDLGASMLGGVTYSALTRYWAPPTPGSRERVVDAYGRLAERARSAGIRLGIEPVNRYESNFINTLGQAAEVVRTVDPETLFVQMDTYHMNIEENDIAGAIEATGDVLAYAHVGESNRRALGSGTFDFSSYFKALARVGYTGGFTWESFSASLVGPDVTGLLAIWREPWADPREAAADALAFMRAHTASAAAAATGE
jgi:D-psicose/D-tagatose/L-ribulose 3-epimerase